MSDRHDDVKDLLESKSRGMGGTCMAKLLALDPEGRDALHLYYEKTRPRPERNGDEGIDVWRGRRHEPIAAGEFWQKTGMRGRSAPEANHPAFPAFVCHPDYDIFAAPENPHEGPGTLEIKCPRASVVRHIIDHGLPLRHTVQLQTYLAVQRRAWGAFGIYATEHDEGPIIPIIVEADPDLGRELLTWGQRFWDEHVVKRVPPVASEWALLGNPDAPAILATRGSLTVLTHDDAPDLYEMVEDAIEASRLKKDAEDVEKTAKKAVQDYVEENLDTDRIQIPGIAGLTHAKITVVRNEGQVTFSEKLLRAHRPIDRDKLEAWIAEYPEVWLDLEEVELDLDTFQRQGSPYSYPLITTKE